MINIDSKMNNKIKDLIRLRDDSTFRNDKSLFYVEGERLFKDTPHYLVKDIFIKKDKVLQFSNLLNNYDRNNIYVLSDDIYNKVSDTVNSQGIIATVKYNILKQLDVSLLQNIHSCIILDSISDPGNLGTILRVSEAAGVNLIILTNKCCNIYNTKVIRASMSSIFRNNIYVSSNILADISILKNNCFSIYVTSVCNDNTYYTDIKYDDKFVIVFGNEANGVSSDIINNAKECIYIPMRGEIESLNVSISTSIILYEAMRQNNFYEN